MLISFSLTGHYASFQAFGLLLWNISNHTLMTMSVIEIIYSVLFKGKGLWHFNTRACGQIPILHCKMGIWVVVEVIQCFKWFSLSFPLYWWWYIFRVFINLKLQLVPLTFWYYLIENMQVKFHWLCTVWNWNLLGWSGLLT